MKALAQKRKSSSYSGITNARIIGLSMINFVIFSGAVYTYFSGRRKVAEALEMLDRAKSMMSYSKARVSSSSVTHQHREEANLTMADIICVDEVWCSIPPPTISHFSFEPPIDEVRWKLAQSQAASGEQVLLQRISKVFPHPFNFLDGDKSFRRIHNTIDVFIDSKEDFQALLPGGLIDYNFRRSLTSLNDSEIILPEYSQVLEKEVSRRKLRITVLEGAIRNGVQAIDKRSVIPSPYDFREANRAPVVQIGYIAFKKDGGTYFSGDFMGGVFIKRLDFLKHWAEVKDKIDTPFVALCVLNENWGWLSTMFPNRTAGWGKCCDKADPLHKNLHDFLDNEKTLMLVVGQHSNISHPKLLTYPRGIPLTWYVTITMSCRG